MDKKTYAIGILALTAVVLFIAQFLPIQPAVVSASEAVRDPATEIQMVTARNTQGGDSLYIISRDGVMVVLQYDPQMKGMRVQATRSLPEVITTPRR
jgi:hypothetical protein